MPFGVTFQYHSQKSTSSRFKVLSGSCLTAGGHAASFINQVCIMLVNSFAIPDGIMNRAGQEAQACAFSCFRARNIIVCSSGVCLVPFFALAISRALTSMDANPNTYPILIPPASNTFYFCHHSQPHHSQPYHAQSIIYHLSFVINGC